MNSKNKLSKEKSPYLLQHKDNPVNWYSWGQEAFDAAAKEDKPIFLSVGYSTCYWCHVMEQDSFENEDVAKILNDSFINIKVDREERPDIDQIYMDAAVAMTGRGGWPLTAILTSDLKPFFGGTFFPKDQLTKLLLKIGEMWENERDGLIKSSNEITEALSSNRNPEKAFPLDQKVFDGFLEQTENNYDQTYGGFGRAPKFPPTQALRMLLRIFNSSKNESAMKMCVHTLDCMARGGIYDHIDGGFARYSVDEKWAIPHFEKMLYDNALIAMTYLEAAQATGSEMFESVATETLDYIIRVMQSDEGGYYSAQDAGDVGSEGEYYGWLEQSVESILSEEEFSAVKESFNLTAHGNFEDNFNILNFDKNTEWADKKTGVLGSGIKKLFKAREERRSPHLDDKVLTSWNALTVSAMLKAYQVSGDKKYLDSAESCMRFIKTSLWKENTLLRRYRDGESKFSGYLDDYAYLTQAALDFYETNGESEWLNWAIELQSVLDERFWDSDKAGYFFTEEDGEVRIFRKKEFTDNSTPSGNGVSALNLLRLYHLSYNEHFLKQAKAVMTASSYFANQYPSALCSTLIALNFKMSEPWELVVKASRDSEFGNSLEKFLFKTFLPNKVTSWPKDERAISALPHLSDKRLLEKIEDKDTGAEGSVFLCRNKTCLAPMSNLDEVRSALIKSAS